MEYKGKEIYLLHQLHKDRPNEYKIKLHKAMQHPRDLEKNKSNQLKKKKRNNKLNSFRICNLNLETQLP